MGVGLIVLCPLMGARPFQYIRESHSCYGSHYFVRTLQAELVVLGGAFFVNGNVNPAAEANIFGDAEAADLVLGLCPRCRMVGLDVTHQVHLSYPR